MNWFGVLAHHASRTPMKPLCVFGDESHTVRGTDISGFTVSGFSGFGVLLLMADNSSVSNTEASHND